MKNIFSLAVVLLLLATSCQKEITSTVDAPIPALQNVTLKNGRLHFPDEASLRATQQAMNQEETVDLTEWVESMGILSIQELYLEVNEAYSHVQDEQGYREFMAKYEDVLYITPENSISVKGYYPFLAQVLTVDGEMYVGDALVKYTNTHKITIPDGDEGKLAQAINATTSTDEIQVQELKFEDMNLGARNSGCSSDYVWHDCYYGTHERIYGRYFLEADFINNTILPNNPLFFYPYEGNLLARVLSEYKGFLGIWYLNRTNITWSIGWGVESINPNIRPFSHGTGWTANNVSQINYSFTIPNPPPVGMVRPIEIEAHKYSFTYFYANLATPNISCSHNCP